MNGKVDAVWAMAAAVAGEEAGDPPLHPGPGPGLAQQHALTPHSSLLLMLTMCDALGLLFSLKPRPATIPFVRHIWHQPTTHSSENNRIWVRAMQYNPNNTTCTEIYLLPFFPCPALVPFLSCILPSPRVSSCRSSPQYTTPPISSESWRTMILQQK